MYLPPTKYKIKQTSGSDNLVDNDGNFYKGSYLELYNGEIYQGSNIESIGSRLIQVSLSNTSTQDTSYIDGLFKSKIIKPFEEDYEREFYYRYFLQSKKPMIRLVEVDRYRYVKASSISEIDTIRITWRLKGYKDDVIKNGVTYKGVSTFNSEEIERVSSTFPKLKILLKNTTQYGQFL
jgi:hypothetical protein